MSSLISDKQIDQTILAHLSDFSKNHTLDDIAAACFGQVPAERVQRRLKSLVKRNKVYYVRGTKNYFRTPADL